MMFLAQDVFSAYAIISSSMTAVFTSLGDSKTISQLVGVFPMQLLFLLSQYLSSDFQANSATSYPNVCKTQIMILKLLPSSHSTSQSAVTCMGHNSSTRELWTGIGFCILTLRCMMISLHHHNKKGIFSFMLEQMSLHAVHFEIKQSFKEAAHMQPMQLHPHWIYWGIFILNNVRQVIFPALRNTAFWSSTNSRHIILMEVSISTLAIYLDGTIYLEMEQQHSKC